MANFKMMYQNYFILKIEIMKHDPYNNLLEIEFQKCLALLA